MVASNIKTVGSILLNRPGSKIIWENLTRSQKVSYVYRRALVELRNQCPNRLVFNYEARKIREEFEEFKGETDPGKIEFLLQRALYWIEFLRHPQPYVLPDAPGGSKFARNWQLPDEVIKANSDMVEEEHKYRFK